jgi:hypothetical protein
MESPPDKGSCHTGISAGPVSRGRVLFMETSPAIAENGLIMGIGEY